MNMPVTLRPSAQARAPLGAREGAGDVAAGRMERSARPLPVAGAGLDQAAQRLVCGAAPRAVLDGRLIARQADGAVDVADGTGSASSRTPHPAAEQAGPQVLRAPVAAALSSPPPAPPPGGSPPRFADSLIRRDFPTASGGGMLL